MVVVLVAGAQKVHTFFSLWLAMIQLSRDSITYSFPGLACFFRAILTRYASPIRDLSCCIGSAGFE